MGDTEHNHFILLSLAIDVCQFLCDPLYQSPSELTEEQMVKKAILNYKTLPK